MTPEQYVSLSAIANDGFAPQDNNKTLRQLIEDGKVDGATTIEGQVVHTKPELSSVYGLLDYVLVAHEPNTEAGFAGSAFQHPTTGEIVFAFRQTEDIAQDLTVGIRDIYTDLQLALPGAPIGEPNQFRDAYSFVKETLESVSGTTMTETQLSHYVSTNNTSFTGHSLGGGLVQYVIHKLDAGSGTTFDAVGIGQAIGVVDPSYYDSMITDYVNADDWIGNYGMQLGTTKYLQGTTDMTNVDLHAVANLLSIVTSMISGDISSPRGAQLLRDAMSGMNSETKAYVTGGWTESHYLHRVLNSGELSEEVSDNNVEIVIEHIEDMFGALSDSNLPGIAAGAVSVYDGVSEVTDALRDFSGSVANLVVSTVDSVGMQIGSIVDSAITDLQAEIASAGNNAGVIGTEVTSAFQDISTQAGQIIHDANVQLVQSMLLAADGFFDLFEAANVVSAAADIAERILRGESVTSAIFAELDDRLGLAADGLTDIRHSIGDIVMATSDAIASSINVIYQEASDHLSRILPAVVGLVDNTIDIAGMVGGAVVDTLAAIGQGLMNFGEGFEQELSSFTVSLRSAMQDTISNLGDIVDAAGILLSGSLSALIESVTFDNLIDFIGDFLSGIFNPISPNDSIEGTNNSDIIYGYSGDNIVQAHGGDDTIFGGAGDDTLIGGTGSDMLLGGAGDDTLYGGSETNQDGFFNPNISGDTLDGGAGNDRLEGGSGDDIYIFGKGYGDDVIRDYAFDVVGRNNAGFDTIEMLPSVSPSDVDLRRDGSSLLLTLAGTDDTLTILDYFSHNGYSQIEQITFANGAVWDLGVILDKARYMYGTHEGDTINGYHDQDNIIYAGSGDDTVNGSYAADTLYGEDGSDTLLGQAGNDILDGGSGDDVLEGGANDDTYVFGRGYGHDTIFDEAPYSPFGTPTGGFDTLLLNPDVSPGDIEVYRVGASDLELKISDTSDRVTIKNHFNGNLRHTIDQIKFSDGTIWDIDGINSRAVNTIGTEQSETLQGNAADNHIFGNGGDDSIYGQAGHDSLYGDGGNDILDGGVNDDYLEGGMGNDTYVFGIGYGKDVIYDSDSGLGGSTDKVTFLAGINPGDVSVRRLSNSDLELSFAGTEDKLTIERYFSPYYKNSSFNAGIDSNVVEEFHFANNTVWTATTIKDKVRTIRGTENDDMMQGFADQSNILYAGAGNDEIYSGGMNGDELFGEEGNDILIGSSANELLDGGVGNDYLEGEVGNDTYVFGPGYGKDTIYDNDGGHGGSLDKVTFLAGIDPTNVTVKRVGSNLVLTIVNTTDELIVQNYFSPYAKGSSWYTGINSNAIEEFHFADSTVWSMEDVNTMASIINGTENNDEIYGFLGDETINGGPGNDEIYGDDGNDTIDGGVGNDYLDGGSGDDVYSFSGSFGNDTISDYAGNDLIQITDTGMHSFIFEQAGNALYITPDGSNDSIKISHWYNTYGNYKIETVEDASGNTISSTQVEQLIQAMASWSSNNGMSWSQALSSNPQDVQSIVSQYWAAPTA